MRHKIVADTASAKRRSIRDNALELAAILVIDPQHLGFAVGVLKDISAADIAVEHQRVDGLRIPKLHIVKVFHELDIVSCSFGSFAVQTLFILCDRHRFCIIIALNIIAADGGQKIRLIFVLHAFRNDSHIQPPRHAHNGLDDIARTLFIFGAFKETHVKLQNRRRHILQDVQGRIAAAKIIDLHRKPKANQFFDTFQNLLLHTGKRRFRDLQTQEVDRNLVLLHETTQIRDHIRMLHITPRNVHRKRQHRAPLRSPPLQQHAGMLPNVTVHRIDKAVLFKNFDKFCRGDILPILIPAHQHFAADERARRMIILRLDPKLELLLGECIVHIKDDLLPVQQSAS